MEMTPVMMGKRRKGTSKMLKLLIRKPLVPCLVCYNISWSLLFLRGGKREGGKEEDEAAQREKERQQLLAEIDEKKRKILREVEVCFSLLNWLLMTGANPLTR